MGEPKAYGLICSGPSVLARMNDEVCVHCKEPIHTNERVNGKNGPAHISCQNAHAMECLGAFQRTKKEAGFCTKHADPERTED